MKRIGIVTMIMALMLLLVSSVSAADIFADDFESGLTEWTVIDPDNSEVLNYQTEPEMNGDTLAHAGDQAAFMYGDNTNPVEVAIEKELDLTDYENVAIEFWWAEESFESPDGEAKFQVSTDGGSTWDYEVTLVTPPTTDQHDTAPADYTQENIDLSAYDGESSLTIRFSAELKTGIPAPEAMDFFIIDDVTVTGDIVNNPPTITSTAVTDAIEDQAYTYDVEAEDLDDDTLTFSLTTKPDGMTINEDTGVITWTPDYTQVGDNDVVVKVDDGIDFDTQSFTIEVEEVNDQPIVDVSECTEDYGVEDVVYTCEVSATDEEDGDVTASLTSSKGTVTAGTLTWTPSEDDIGSNTINIIAEDSEELQGSAYFTVFVRPEDVCGDYESGTDVKITDWGITDEDEDFYPGSNIEIEIDVENDGDEDLEDIVVEAMLYDVTDGKRIDVVKTDEFDLDEDEDETVELILEIPEDIDTDNKFVVFFSAYEDGNDDENCNWDFSDDLSIKRRKHDVNIEKVVVTPSTVDAGKTVDVKVDVENVGDRDEEDVYVKVKSGDLGIDKKSELFDIDAYEAGDDDEYTVTISFKVPEDAEEGNYDLEIYVYDNDDEVYESGTKFVTLFVEGTGTTITTTTTTTTTGSVTISTEGTPEEVEQGASFTIPIEITNTADEAKEYEITVSNIGDWAESTSEFDAYLLAGQTSTYYITVTPNEDAAEGKHSATINVKEGTEVIATKTLSFTIPETSVSGITGGAVVDIEPEGDGLFHNVFSGTTLWIIGDLVLVVVAIFFIRMLFSKKS